IIGQAWAAQPADGLLRILLVSLPAAQTTMTLLSFALFSALLITALNGAVWPKLQLMTVALFATASLIATSPELTRYVPTPALLVPHTAQPIAMMPSLATPAMPMLLFRVAAAIPPTCVPWSMELPPRTSRCASPVGFPPKPLF